MDSHKHGTQVERLEVVETGRRRRWSDDEKLRIAAEMAAAKTTKVASLCAGHAQQLGGESPLPNLMEVKG